MGTLTALTVKNAKAGAKISDGLGLRLDVDRNGNGCWFFRYTSPITGRERLMSLGRLRDVSLSEARDLAADARTLLRKRQDPLELRDQERAAVEQRERQAITFESYAKTYIANHEGAWKNPVHRRNWRNSMRDHAYPIIGSKPICEISTDDVLKLLRPLWHSKHETARNVRQRVEAILAGARAEGLRSGENPAIWRGHLDQILPRRRRTKEHFAALPYDQIPEFWNALVRDTGEAAVLLRFTIATVARYSEAGNACWSEIDLKAGLWTIPSSRMKAGRGHIVPLNATAISALEASRTKEGLVFPGIRTGKTISDVALAKAIKRHTTLPATTHGFRSTFRDWCGDCTDFPRELAEAALAHRVGNAAEQAYRRSTALEKRKALMDQWAAFCVRASSR